MPAPSYEQQQRAFHLKRLDRFLNRMGTFGTQLLEPDQPDQPDQPGEPAAGDYEGAWSGLLVWNNARSSGTGVVVRCDPGSETGAWRYAYGDGTVIAGVFDQLKVVQELTRVLLPSPHDPAG